jgi:putative membrane protein|tara:strand:- start:361 stop:699 length:339 start_codon:yes stop_codon:yes gene_type:complete
MSKWYEEGETPDYRFSLANERTFLAWIRTGLGFFVSAIAIDQMIAYLQLDSKLTILFYAFIVMSAFCIVNGYLRWRGNEINMRHGRPLKYGLANIVLALFSSALLVSLFIIK